MLNQQIDNKVIDAVEFLKKTSFTEFVDKTSPNYLWWWHNRYLCRVLEKFTNDIFLGKNPILIVTMPPRSGKSHIVSVRFPTWFMSQASNLEFVLASYGQTLSDKASLQARSLINSEYYKNVYGNALVGRKIANWYLSNGSSFRGTGIGGGLTGEGMHCGAIDDPIKNPEMAKSQLQKDKQWEWYDTVFTTRTAPNFGIIINLTRWARDDIAGRVLEQKKDDDNITLINMPALATNKLHPADPRKPGEALHPARYNRKRLLKIKRNFPATWWSAMYEQNPIPDGGFIIKEEHIGRYFALPQTGKLYQSWDFSFGSKTRTSSYTVGQMWLMTRSGYYYLIEQYRKKVGYNAMLAAIKSMMNKYPHCSKILVEKKAAGSYIIENIRSIAGRKLEEVNPIDDKEERLETCSPVFENNQIYIPDESLVKKDTDGKTWTSKYIAELTEFPTSTNDDQVDATTQLLNFTFNPLSNIVIGDDNEQLKKKSYASLIL